MKTGNLICLFLILACITSCKKWQGIPLEFQDPQDTRFLEEVLPSALIQAFGEEHIHYGPIPPNLDGISFKVEGMTYDTCVRYIFGPNGEVMLSPTAPPTHEGTLFFHHFWNQQEQISKHKLKTIDPSGNIFIRSNDTIYLIGHDSVFTAYYQETITEPQSGNPTNYVIVSGTVVRNPNNNTFVGIRNYRMGKMIKSYKQQPEIPSYAPGTIEIKKHEGVSPYFEWDN